MDIRTTYHDHGDEGAVITRQQYVADIVDDCKARHNQGAHGSSDFKHVARVPAIVVEHYCNVNKIKLGEFARNPEHWRRLLNDPAFSDLRIWPGKI